MKLSLAVTLLAAPSALAGDLSAAADNIMSPAPSNKSPWKLSAGSMFRHIGSTTLDTSPQFIAPSGIGGLGAFEDRTYDDGFVNIGAPTAATGLTPNWGYDNNSQVSGGMLSFQRSGGLAIDSPGRSSEDDDTIASPYIEISYLHPIRPGLEIGATATMSFSDLGFSAGNNVTAYGVTATDTYDLNGVIPPLAPYSGSFTGPGPLISQIPTFRNYTLSTIGSYPSQFENDTDLYTMALGGELHWKPVQNFYLGVGAGVVLNIADWEAKQDTPIISAGVPTVSAARYAENDIDFLLGLYLKGTAGYQINSQWSVETFFRYDLSKDLDGSVGTSEFTTDLSGWSVGLGVGYRF